MKEPTAGVVRQLSQIDRKGATDFLVSLPVDAHLIADLGDFIWQRSRWWQVEDAGEMCALACLIEGLFPVPILCVSGARGSRHVETLLATITPHIDDVFVLGPLGVEQAFADFTIDEKSCGTKMLLGESHKSENGVTQLHADNIEQVTGFLGSAYLPHEAETRLFEPYMLELWPHVAIFENDEIVALGGTHIYSDQTHAAGIGNIVTRPDRRGAGYAGRIVRSLCATLQADGARLIGLNVAASNKSAIRVYEKCGFRPTYQFEEFHAFRRPGQATDPQASRGTAFP